MALPVSGARLALLAAPLGGLLLYKWPSAWSKVTGVAEGAALSLRAPALSVGGLGAVPRTLALGLDYLLAVWPALVFGLVLSAAVRAFLPTRWVERLLDRGPIGGQLAAAAAAAPLMLCSCCVAPMFGAVHARRRRFGPAAAILLGSPSLNPAALALTFVLFGSSVGGARLVMAVAAVLLIGPVVERLAGNAHAGMVPETVDEAGLGGALRSFGVALRHTLLRAVPPVIVGVFLSAALAQHVDFAALGASVPAVLAAALLAGLALPLALPTFFELPIGLALAAGGAPDGAVAAVLFAGPAINLPSLLSVAREASPRAAVGLAAGVWIVASVVGALLP